jgi:hypothetical protein
MTGRFGAPFRLGERLNTAAKVLVIVCCGVVLGSVIETVVREPAPELRRPEAMNDMGPRPRTYLWQDRLGSAVDYAALIDLALPVAQAGNADAQFALYGAFSYCRDMTRRRTPEEARRLKIMSPVVEPRCNELAAQFPDFAAEADRWLAQSLERKFPRAFALDALEDLNELTRNPPPGTERARRIESARTRLLFALNSNDPAITQVVPHFLPAFFPDDLRIVRARWVWLMAACEQGLRCDSGSKILQEDCMTHDRCSAGESVTAYIRRVSGDFPSLMQRARNLARTLRNSRLDGKTFDQTVTSFLPARVPGQ